MYNVDEIDYRVQYLRVDVRIWTEIFIHYNVVIVIGEFIKAKFNSLVRYSTLHKITLNTLVNDMW
jgi:hypothetical protein